MAEPQRQVEVQLGHLCNNRCVFCVSGQLSELDRAPQLPIDPIRSQIRDARAGGATKITFLGGEPTIQRSFLELLEEAVRLDFDEVVVFTNGVMTPRASFRKRALAVLERLGPDMRRRVIWRFSLQGGDRDAHDATTCNPGAWERIQESLEVLHAEGARLTGNMCVVESNYRSVERLADVARQFDFENVHLDMVRPRDAGDRTDAHLRSIMARYSDMAPHFRALARACETGLGEDFDVNIGNLPYCIAPDLAAKMHHDGEFTITVAASGDGRTQEGFDKYLDKRTDKRKVAACGQCVLETRCSGIFEKYVEFHGDDEFVAIDAEALWASEPRGQVFIWLVEPTVRAWLDGGTQRRMGRIDERSGEIEVQVGTAANAWLIQLRPPTRQSAHSGWFAVETPRFTAALLGVPPAGEAALGELHEALSDLGERLGVAVELDAFGEVGARARGERARLLDQAKLRERGRQRALQLARRLERTELAGLRQQGLGRSTDGRWLEVSFADGEARLVLSIGLDAQAAELASGRPTLRHQAHGLDSARIAAFNSALGNLLRGRESAPQAAR